MSMPIHEKIERIRNLEALSQQDFSEMIGLSVNTLKGIIKRGSSPRFEVVEQIARRWPQYAYWLLTDKTMPPAHTSPVENDKEVFRIFDVVDNPEPVVTEMMVKPEWLTQLTFIQPRDEISDLYCLLQTKKTDFSCITQCINITGNISFSSNDKGMKGLQKLAGFLKYIERGDLIKSSEMKHAFSKDVYHFMVNKECSRDMLLIPEMNSGTWRKIHTNFTKWRMDGEKYLAEHNWNDMND